VLIDLSNTAQLDNTPRWHPLKEQKPTLRRGPAALGDSEALEGPEVLEVKEGNRGTSSPLKLTAFSLTLLKVGHAY
ncbi:hypothetical protein M9458_035942, partial [Cirrhinus mrigala]